MVIYAIHMNQKREIINIINNQPITKGENKMDEMVVNKRIIEKKGIFIIGDKRFYRKQRQIFWRRD